MSEKYQLTIKVKRFDPEQRRSYLQEYQLEAGGILRFVDLLRQINKDLDPTLAWNSSCEHGQCGTCAIMVNGRPMLACELLVERAVAYFKTTTFLLTPLDIAPIVRDLVIDLEAAYDRVHAVKPYIIKPVPLPDGEKVHDVSPQQQDFYVEATRCINCFCCATACLASHKNFLGPNAMLATLVRIMDNRENEKEQRLNDLYSEQGVLRCHTSRACSFVCPKEIDVSHFMALAKEGRFKP